MSGAFTKPCQMGISDLGRTTML